jgi:hypothetical protein
VAAAYRSYALEHPGRYGYMLRPRAGDEEHTRASGEILEVLGGVLAGYGIEDPDTVVDAIRFLRSALHGFVVLEIAGGFAMDRPVDTSFEAAVQALDRALRSWGA